MADQKHEFSAAEVDLFRQWYNAVCDSNPAYLEEADHALGRKVTEAAGGKWYAPPAHRRA